MYLNDKKTYITFDDVLIQPQFSDISSREEISTATSFLGLNLEIPILSSNMDYVTGSSMAIAMWKTGGLGILHRFMPWEEQKKELLAMKEFEVPLSFSVGVKNRDEILYHIEEIRPLIASSPLPVIICIDIAHGHHKNVGETILVLKSKFNNIKIIAGNVATVQGAGYLAYCGADAIKVGIGPGSICTTREVTGVGVPQLSALMGIATWKEEYYKKVQIIADGGIKSSGDIVKALAAGADVVMLGSLLAGTSECPGEAVEMPDGRRYRPYRGQSIFGTNGLRYAPEGVSGFVEEKGPVSGVLKRLVGGLRSGMSYVGARNLDELREDAIFIKVSSQTHIESGTRILTSIGE